ncbi:PREDICTED: uncharacterized protein LOC106816216 [Priapulus caudatus]|uniref:Uncharacterized protein LOC106816216 n=1 Tax=Priapulus caudatus TaxID=37621 RepID=A0ABM1EVQ5_PRICU|nr:PREDICTED: uncharacterized protein LOC106816216 [Priapulus caudatus]
MTVHLFGAASSPSCANLALKKTATDSRDEYNSTVTNTVVRNFYVDDCLKFVSEEDEAMILAHSLRKLLKDRGWKLTKFVNTSQKLLESISPEERAKEIRELDFDRETLPAERALGVYWTVEEDTLGFRTDVTKILLNSSEAQLQVHQ